ncbi:DUF4097 family beta strand repeat-containing protein [Streptomyces paludis]|uniref:DUF4097 domain-containing protein n=1 Tax=Streptomyces paludis TaxID=2282738 RepID=A0A345HLQ4_9ACTN|nr:DUF4097 family beta strand repeat-containing protein [Streptomyces paludis]AXG77628.1 hypothetical protein DVK44_07855 [Streptomyces paludis]
MAAGGALVAALVVSGCGSDPSGAPEEKKSFAFEGKTLTIDAENAEIDLVPADVTSVDVTRQVDGWVLLGSGPKGVWKMDGATLTLKVKCSGLSSDCSSRNEVKVPRGVAVTLTGDNGKVTATGFTTALKLASDNGSITVADSSGPLDLKSDNGSVTARNVSSRTVTVRSDNGAIRLGFSEVPDHVDTLSDNGRTEIVVPPGGSYAVTTSSDNGRVEVDVERDANSPHVVKARSDNGKITVRSAN